MSTLELIKKHGISVRQIPYNNIDSFIINDYSRQRVTPEHEQIDGILARNVTKERFEKMQSRGAWSHAWLENNTVMCKVARKITPRKHGGWWMSKIEYNTGSMQTWSSKEDNLAPTLEESVTLCISKLN